MNISILRYVIVVLYCCSLPLCRANTESAEQCYNRDDFEGTVRILEQMRADGNVSSELFYNLGNAYSGLGDTGAAVLNYAKTLRVNPSNKDARNNLEYTENLVRIANESMTEGKNMDPTPAEASFIEGVRNSISRHSSNQWAVLAAIFFALAIGGAAVYVFMPVVLWRKVGFFGGIFTLLLCAMSIWFSVISKQHALSKDTCVLMISGTQLKLKPAAASQDVGTPLSAGTSLKIMSHEKGTDGADWVQVYLNAEYSGWLSLSDVAIVEVPALEE